MKGLISGQEIPVKILKAILSSGRIAHAYLFKGPAGSGKEILAKEFAKGILCLGENTLGRHFHDQGDTGLSCGLCRSCSEVDKNSHPDLFMIKKDGTSIKIKASHEMLKEVLTRPFLSRRKVFIVHEAESLTVEAANALLKLLEEPPSYITFILTTSNEIAIPSTVISRCQVIPLRSLPAPAIATYLERTLGISNEKSREIASLSDGSIEKAMLLVSQEGEKVFSGDTLIQQIREDSPVELALKYSKVDSDEKARVLAALEFEFSRNLSMAIQRSSGQGLANPHDREEVALKESFWGLKAVMRARERLSANTNSFLVFCVLFMDIHGVFEETI